MLQITPCALDGCKITISIVPDVMQVSIPKPSNKNTVPSNLSHWHVRDTRRKLNRQQIFSSAHEEFVMQAFKIFFQMINNVLF